MSNAATGWQAALELAEEQLASFAPERLAQATVAMNRALQALIDDDKTEREELAAARTALVAFHGRCAYLQKQLQMALIAAATPAHEQASYTPRAPQRRGAHAFISRTV